jgi:WD40 repeat protein
VGAARTSRDRAAREHGGPVGALAFSVDSRWLVSASSDTSVKVWALPDGTVRQALRGHANEVFAVAVSSTGLIASGDCDGVVLLWDLATGAAKGALADPALR